MRISDWSSDVCSSDLPHALHVARRLDLAILFASGGWVSRDAATAASGEDFGEEGGEEEAIGVRGLLDARASALRFLIGNRLRSEEHTSELQSLMRISYAVFCLKKKKHKKKLDMHKQTIQTRYKND